MSNDPLNVLMLFSDLFIDPDNGKTIYRPLIDRIDLPFEDGISLVKPTMKGERAQVVWHDSFDHPTNYTSLPIVAEISMLVCAAHKWFVKTYQPWSDGDRKRTMYIEDIRNIVHNWARHGDVKTLVWACHRLKDEEDKYNDYFQSIEK